MIMRLREIPWESDEAQALCRAQQAEIEDLYGEPDIEPDLPAEQMIMMLVAEVDGQVVSCGALRKFADGVGEVKRMYTVPEFRHRGLGYAILSGLESRAVAEGLGRMVLETGPKQADAIRLYTRSGYHEIPAYGPYVGVERSVCLGKALIPG